MFAFIIIVVLVFIVVKTHYHKIYHLDLFLNSHPPSPSRLAIIKLVLYIYGFMSILVCLFISFTFSDSTP